MLKEKVGSMPKWLKRVIGAAVIIIVVAIVVFIFFSSVRNSASAQAEPDLTILSKGDITKTISVSGVVQSDSVNNIYSTQTAYPVKEIMAEVGDTVKKGDILAILDMSKLENDIAQAEINYQSAVTSAEQELTNNGNSVINAETSLESASISLGRQQLSTSNASNDLKDAQDKTGDFDSYTYDKSITDAQVTLERKTTDLQDAEEDYVEALTNFDDYAYQNTIRDALITLQRKQEDLATAEDDLDEAKRGSDDEFDDYSYQSAINTAKNNISKAEDSLDSAYTARETAKRNLNTYVENNPEAAHDATNTVWSNLNTAVDTAEKSISTAQSSLDDAYTALDKARNDYDHAEEQYEQNIADADEAAVEAAQKTYDNAKNLADDAQRTYDKAVSDLARARDDAIDNTYDKLISAQNALEDAQRTYEKAVNDKLKASEDYDDSVEDQIKSAQKTLNDSRKQLESSQNSYTSAENSLEQVQTKVATQGSSVELQKLSLEKLYTQLSEGTIYATADGVITEKNAKVGANPSGVLFVIEDVDDLYASANVKEYNLSQIEYDQPTLVTTDATGENIYDASVSYISPKAVSAAGSTSVEFEVRAKLTEPDRAIKIGMNAYLNVITDTRENVFVVSVSMISYENGQGYVYTYANGETEMIPVSVGLKTSSVAEITGSGLYEGMELLSDPDAYFAGPVQQTTGFVMTTSGG